MKLAFINSFCGYGSTGSGVLRRKQMFESWGHQVRVYYGINEQKDLNDCYYFSNKLIYKIENRISIFLGLSGMLSFIPTIKLLSNLRKYNPDVIWISNIHGNYVNEYWLLTALKKMNKWVVYGMPDEYAFLGKCCSAYDCDKYKIPPGCRKCPHVHDYPVSKFFDNSSLKFALKKKAYHNFNKLILRSAPYVVNKAHESILLSDKEYFASDSSVDLENIFYPRDTKEIKQKLGISDHIVVVLCCAPFRDKLKGVKYFVEAAKQCKRDDIIFIDVGFGEEEIEIPSNFIRLPYEKNKNILAQYYSLADLYVCPSVSDAQPNACLEALGCGTPILGFNVSGIPYIAESPFGIFVEPVSAKGLLEIITTIKKKDKITINQCRNYAIERFSMEASYKRFFEFGEMLQKRVDNDKRR